MPIVFYAHLETEAKNKEEAETKLNEMFNKAYYQDEPLDNAMNNFHFTDFEREPVVEEE